MTSDIEYGPKMLACSERERKFVLAYVAGGESASEAARQAGYSDPGGDSSAIRVQAHALMHRERVLEAIDEVGRKEFRGLLLPAVVAIRTILGKSDHPDYLKTAATVLSRLGLGERSGVDVNVSGEVAVNHTDAALNDLRILMEMGASEAKLEEVFGHSGLSRYRKMLAEKQPKLIAGTGPVIDATPEPANESS